ncbi:MAG: VWA domain-containing protein, partial [Hyphomicrobiales bacterium]
MKYINSVAIAACLLFAPTVATSALAQSTSMFILDASGSMWGRLPDNQMKIVAARDAMGELLGALPQNISTGLIAYGHRKKGDCGDIEVVQDAVAGGGAKIAARIGTIQPRGKTPISASLQLAGSKLTGIEDPTTIVLVSDGIETCEGDPCAVAESLAQSQANLNIHVIGYAVDIKTKTQLQCVAEKGRGKYFTADNLGELESALTTVTESIKTAEPIKIAAPEVEAPKVDNNSASITIEIAGPGTIKLKLADWVTEPKYWKILDPETGEEVVKTSEDEISTMAGDYQLAWRHVEHGAH